MDERGAPGLMSVRASRKTGWGSAFYVYDPAGGGLKLREYSQYVRDQVLRLKLDPTQLLGPWADAVGRRALRELEGQVDL